MSDARKLALVDDLRRLPAETDWVEFKVSNADPQRWGRTVSAIANSARLADKLSGHLVWGIEDAAHEVVGTGFEPGAAKQGNEPLPFWLEKALQPGLVPRFEPVEHPGGRVVVLEVPAAHTVPVNFQGIAYVRVGSATLKLADHPPREAALIDKLRPFVWEQGASKTFVSAEEVLDLRDFPAYVTLTKQPMPEGQARVLERLAEDRLIVRDVGDHWNVTNLGAALFAKRLDRFAGLARKALRVVQYDGTSRAKTTRSQEG